MARPLGCAAAALSALACGCSDPAATAPRSCLIVTLDTTNPGALDCYGKDRGFTPNLSALAAEGVVYEEARSVTPITLPAHTSIMTGLYPPRHTVRENGLWVVPQSADTLAERARRAGFSTSAIVAASVLASRYALDQGFDHYESPKGRVRGPLVLDRPAAEVTDAAIAWLAARDRTRPFFLWVHYFDPHFPYAPPAQFLEQAGNAYFGEVAYMDHELGRLLDHLRADGAYDDAVIAVVGDHGESLGRHGEQTHAFLCYDATLRVPLILRHPGGARAGERSSEIVSQVDVFATLLELMRLGPPGDVDGLNLAAGPVPEGRGVYFESYYGMINFNWGHIAGWLDAGGKYLHSARPEFYDVARDPGEERNLAVERAARLAGYREGIRDVAARPSLALDAAPQAGDQRGMLEALGYAGEGDPDRPLPHPLDTESEVLLVDRIDEWSAFDRAAGLALLGQRDEAIDVLRACLTANPTSQIILNRLGRYLSQADRPEEAVRTFEQLLGQSPILAPKNEAWIHHYVGYWYQLQGEWETALRHYRQALRLDPKDRRTVLDTARALERLGEVQEAQALRATVSGREDEPGDDGKEQE